MKHQSFCTRAVYIGLGCSIALLGQPCSAYADIRDTDTVLDTSFADAPEWDFPDINSEHALLIDKSGTVYYQRDAQELGKIASITKVITALVVLEHRDLVTSITISSDAASIGESSAGLLAGDTLDTHNALVGLMLASGNDCALALAETYGQAFIDARLDGIDPNANPVEAFVAQMNAQAQTYGATNSIFTNPHGLDDGEYASNAQSSAHDVGLLVRQAMSYPEFVDIVSLPSATILVTNQGQQRSVPVTSTDILLDVYEGMCGVKTGFTDAAGYCFAGANKRPGQEAIYTVVLKNPSELGRFQDTKEIMNWYYTHMQTRNMYDYLLPAPEADEVSFDHVVARVMRPHTLDRSIQLGFTSDEALIHYFDLQGPLQASLVSTTPSGSVAVGDVIARLEITQGTIPIASFDLAALEDSKAPGLFERIGAGVVQGFQKLFFGKEPALNSLYLSLS